MKKIYLLLALFVVVGETKAQISLVNFSTGYTAPVDIKNCGDDRLFIVERSGYIWICDTDGVKSQNPFLDIDARVNSGGGEQGLLGLAFPPDFLSSGYFYVNYIGLNGDTYISRFHVDSVSPDSADPNSEEILLVIHQPYTNHNGGHIDFGPDGYLYIGMGDGGSGGDPGNRSQNPDSLLGKMLRIEVDPSYPGYQIPTTNIFANDSTLGRREIWSIGWRNPWRFSFDGQTGDMWAGDVGQNLVEEIDFEPANSPSGLNYGWKCWEGSSQHSTIAGCLPFNEYAPPAHEYTHSPGGYCSVTGGYIYRGTKYQELYGKYFYADYCNSELQYLVANDSGGFTNTNLGALNASSVTTFGEDRHGELYLSSSGNKIMRIISADCTPVSTINLGIDTMSDCGSGSVQLNVPANATFSYTWTYNSTTVDSTASFIATQPGWYYVTVDNQGCTGTDSIMVNIGAPAPVSFSGLDSIYCVYNNPVILTPNPSGGIFSGPGITGQGFFPADAGLGTHNIVYSYSDAFGCISTDTQAVIVDACLGLPENDNVENISIIPNPSSGNFSIQSFSKNQKSIRLMITDITGRVVLNEEYVFNAGENSIPIELNAPKGIYHVRISDGAGGSVVRLTIQ